MTCGNVVPATSMYLYAHVCNSGMHTNVHVHVLACVHAFCLSILHVHTCTAIPYMGHVLHVRYVDVDLACINDVTYNKALLPG